MLGWLFASTFFIWLGIGMLAGALYVGIRYGIPVFAFGLTVITGIIKDCSRAFVEGFREGPRSD